MHLCCDSAAEAADTAVPAASAADPLQLQTAQALADHPLRDGQIAATAVAGDALASTADTDLSLKGHAALRRALTSIRGDAIHYAFDTDWADAYGHVTLVDDGNTFTGPDAHWQLDAHHGTIATPVYHFRLTDGRGSARRTGLLPPTFSVSSGNGFELATPIYVNLAPNYDLTLTPHLIANRGEMLAAEYRYLSPTYAGSLSFAYLPDDRQTHTNRYSVVFAHQWTLGHGFGFYANYHRVSDVSVASDLMSVDSQSTGSTTLYQQEAGLTYAGGPWTGVLRVQHWQAFGGDSTYNSVPQLDVHYDRYNVDGFDFGVNADATRFRSTAANMTEGDRLVIDSYVDYSIARPGWFITPKLKWHFASYDLSSIGSDAPAGQPKRFNVSVPTLSLDSGMQFERSVRLFGNAYLQTLEPRLFYVYTPYRNQTYAPLFDTAVADFGMGELFSDNTFVGRDRVADASRLTAALTSRFLDPATGAEVARFVIAQQYDFRLPQVTLILPPFHGHPYKRLSSYA